MGDWNENLKGFDKFAGSEKRYKDVPVVKPRDAIWTVERLRRWPRRGKPQGRGYLKNEINLYNARCIKRGPSLKNLAFLAHWRFK